MGHLAVIAHAPGEVGGDEGGPHFLKASHHPLAAFRLQGVRDPLGEALAVVAKWHPLAPDSPETLRDLVKLVVPSRLTELWEEDVSEWEADGALRLDRREGVVWLPQGEEAEAQ